jgi:hypothetical protein
MTEEIRDELRSMYKDITSKHCSLESIIEIIDESRGIMLQNLNKLNRSYSDMVCGENEGILKCIDLLESKVIKLILQINKLSNEYLLKIDIDPTIVSKKEFHIENEDGSMKILSYVNKNEILQY